MPTHREKQALTLSQNKKLWIKVFFTFFFKYCSSKQKLNIATAINITSCPYILWYTRILFGKWAHLETFLWKISTVSSSPVPSPTQVCSMLLQWDINKCTCTEFSKNSHRHSGFYQNLINYLLKSCNTC